ncbi:MAG: O-antigen ligase family protein [Prolixibacteraceae bacterium]
MLKQLNPFELESGSDRLANPAIIAIVISVALIAAWMISKMGMTAGAVLIILPFIAIYLNFLFRFPIIGLYSAILLGFVLLGLGKYLSGIPMIGTTMDGILIFTYVALIFNRFKERIDFGPANKDITYLAILWFGYSLFELINPEARSSAAWFSGRGVALYMLLIVPLTLLFIDSNRKLDIFFYIWGIMSLLASLNGMKQHFFGVDQWEQAWLNDGNAQTHILFGKLRSFSFMSDAGQFGANQGYSALVAFIFSTVQTEKRKKIFFLVVAIFALYGMILSGTRGAMSVPLAGFMAFFVLRKNIRVMLIGFFLLLVVFVFFKYTTIAQGNDQVRRMRTAFDPNDASLQVRLENQRRLKVYLASRPFGGGIGLGGVKAQKYLPNAFLSQVATDSWYVLIWVEQGIVGLLLHLFILFYALVKGSYYVVFRIRDPILQIKMAALASGMFGIMVASYGNAVLGAMPTGMLIYTSMALLVNTDRLDTPLIDKDKMAKALSG